jgi:23S rRNA pseudouridine1911/1915/1917 synthase
MAVVATGRPATTRYRTLALASGLACLELGLETGRTHQIRVHLKSAGHPLVGDPVYGEARFKGFGAPARRLLESFPRPALHAWRLRFEHPTSGGEVTVEAPVPSDLVQLWTAVTAVPFPIERAGPGAMGPNPGG